MTRLSPEAKRELTDLFEQIVEQQERDEARLREKLEVNPAEPRLLVTEAGVGYRLVEQD